MLSAEERIQNKKEIRRRVCQPGGIPKLKDYQKENLSKMPLPQKRACKTIRRIAHDVFGFHVEPEKIFAPYIIDIYIKEIKVGIEIDGGVNNNQHTYDEKRDFFLLDKHGLKIFRFENSLVGTQYFKHSVWAICYSGLVDHLRKVNDTARHRGVTVHVGLETI